MADDNYAADLTAALGDSSAQSDEGPAAAVDATAQPGAATTEPAAGTTETTSTEPANRQGVPPEKNWPTILENARTKAVEEWKGKYGWAEQVDQQKLQNAMEFYSQYQNASDPVEFVQQLVTTLQNHPDHGQRLRSMAARALASARGQGQASETPDLSQVVIDLGNGQQLPLSAFGEQIRQQTMRELAPQLSELKTLAAQREQAAAEAFGVSAFEQLKALPNFEEHKADVGEMLKRMQLPKDASPELVLLAAQAAYAQVVPAKLQTSARRSVLTDINHAAQATTVNPNLASTAAPKSMDDMSIAEALRHELSRVG